MNLGRISTAYQYSSMLGDIENTQTSMVNLEQQISSGKKFTDMSTDPLSASSVLSYTSLQNRYTQTKANLNAANNYLNATSSALSTLNDAVNSANTLALQGSNATTDTTELNALANQVDSLMQNVVLTGNTQTATGTYLFAGQSSTTKPYSVAAGALGFAGDDNAVMVETAPGSKTQVNLANGSQVFTGLYQTLSTLKSNLLSGNTAGIQQSLTALQSQQQTVSGAQSSIGITMQQVQNLSTQHQTRIDDLTKSISNVQDVDLATAMTKYSTAQVAYQASLQALTRGTQYSLLDFLR